MSARKRPPERRPPDSVADAAERLAEIVKAAEAAASTVIDDAEKQAHRRLEEAQAEADRIAAERLRALADELDPPGAAERLPAPVLKPVEAGEGAANPEEDSSPGRRAGSAGARLLATEMAVSGASRKEIDKKLRSRFKVEDTSEILDAILGPEE